MKKSSLSAQKTSRYHTLYELRFNLQEPNPNWAFKARLPEER
jgi:hypothetical protein